MNEALSIGAVVIALGSIVSLFIGMKKMLCMAEKREITPQPLQVQAVEAFATKAELNALETRMREDVSLIRADLRGLRENDLREIRQNDVRTRGQIDNLTRATYAVAGKLGVVVNHD